MLQEVKGVFHFFMIFTSAIYLPLHALVYYKRRLEMYTVTNSCPHGCDPSGQGHRSRALTGTRIMCKCCSSYFVTIDNH